MALLVECPRCKHRQYDDCIPCKKCSSPLGRSKNYWIEFYTSEGKRKRERIGPSKSLAETTLRKRLVARAEGRLLDKKKDDKLRFDQLTKWYLTLAETKAKKSFDRDRRSIDKLGAFF